MNIEELLECHELISDFEKAIKNEKNIIKKHDFNNILKKLKQNWIEIAKTDYPMVINDNNKKVNIKTIIKEREAKLKKELKNQPKPSFIPPTLDKIIERTSNDTKLVGSLYDRDFASDIPDPYRKRRKP